MKEFITILSKDCRLAIPRPIQEIMKLEANDYIILRIDPSMKSFTVYKAKVEAIE